MKDMEVKPKSKSLFELAFGSFALGVAAFIILIVLSAPFLSSFDTLFDYGYVIVLGIAVLAFPILKRTLK